MGNNNHPQSSIGRQNTSIPKNAGPQVPDRPPGLSTPPVHPTRNSGTEYALAVANVEIERCRNPLITPEDELGDPTTPTFMETHLLNTANLTADELAVVDAEIEREFKVEERFGSSFAEIRQKYCDEQLSKRE